MATAAQKKNAGSSSDSKAELLKDVKPAQKFLNKFNNDWVMNFSGIIAYNLMLAIFPIAIAILGITGLILGGNPVLKNSITNQADKIAGLGSLVKLASTQLSNEGGLLVIIAILTAIFGGSRLFVTLEGILDLLYHVRPRPIIRQNLVAIGMLLLFVILIPIMVAASIIPTVFSNLLKNPTLKSVPVLGTITSGIGGIILVDIAFALIGVLVSFLLFEAIYFVVPNQKISWHNSWKGAIAAAVLLEIFLVAFPFYTKFFLRGYAGQIGLIIILLIFFYYFAVILLLGAEVNAYFSEKVQPLPNDLVTFVSTMGGKLNRDIPSAESDTHINPHPTDSADKAHVEDELQRDGKVQTRNKQLQHQIASAAKSNDQGRAATKEKKKQAQGSNRMMAVVSGVAGTALAFLFQLLRFRHHGR